MSRYITDMVNEAFPGGMHRTYQTPADTDLHKVVYEASIKKDTTHAKTEIGKRFRRLVMQMLFCASMARPDVALAVGLLTRVQVQVWPSPAPQAGRARHHLPSGHRRHGPALHRHGGEEHHELGAASQGRHRGLL